jgi:hypothetical protein
MMTNLSVFIPNKKATRFREWPLTNQPKINFLPAKRVGKSLVPNQCCLM